MNSFLPKIIDLAFTSQAVIALRALRFMSGDPGEARLMVLEKIEAAHAAGLHLASGGCPSYVLYDYQRRVRLNLDRLSQGSS